MTMRVLLVTSEYPPNIGGIGSHVSELARALASEVPDIAVVRPVSLWGSAPHDSGGVKVMRPPLIMAEPLYQRMLHRWLVRAHAREPFDIIHVHGVRPLGATRGLSAKTVFTNHSSGFLARLHASAMRKRRTARLLKHVAHVIAPSDELVEAARAFGYDGPATMIPNGVDVSRFAPGRSRLRATWGVRDDEVLVLLARRLVEKNGVCDFARSLAFLKRDSFRVVVAGDGSERAKMNVILGEANLLDRVMFLGAVANTDMPEIYRAVDIAVLPSHAEATSIAGLEAMATGVPLVGTRVGGIPAIIADGRTGLLVAPRHPEQLASALQRLIADRALRSALGAAGRARAECEFAWPAIAKRTLSVYRTCFDPVASMQDTSHHRAAAGAPCDP